MPAAQQNGPLLEPPIVIGHEEAMPSGDVFPTQALESIAESGSADATFRGQLPDTNAAFGIPAFHCGNNFLGENGLSLPRAVGVSPFADGVVSIVPMVAEKQMRRVAAARVVAVVENEEPVGNRTMRENPGGTVRSQVAFLKTEYPVTLSAEGTKPGPALIRLSPLYAGPKSPRDCCRLRGAFTFATAKLRIGLQPAGQYVESFRAVLASDFSERLFSRMAVHAGLLGFGVPGGGPFARRRPQVASPSFYEKGVRNGTAC